MMRTQHAPPSLASNKNTVNHPTLAIYAADLAELPTTALPRSTSLIAVQPALAVTPSFILLS